MDPELSAELGRNESVAPSRLGTDGRGLSLRARLLAGMALVVLALAVVGVIVTQTTRAELIDQIDTRLEAAGGGDRYRGAGGPPPPGEFDDRLSDVYEGVLWPDGTLQTIFEPNIVDGPAAPDVDLARAEATGQGGEAFTVGAIDDRSLRYRVRVRAIEDRDLPQGTYWITAIPLTDVDDTIANLITVEVTAGLIILLLLAAVTWWVVRLGIRPIKQMTRTAEGIASKRCSSCRRWP